MDYLNQRCSVLHQEKPSLPIIQEEVFVAFTLEHLHPSIIVDIVVNNIEYGHLYCHIIIIFKTALIMII